MDFKTPTDELRAHTRMLGDLDGSLVYWLHFAQIYGELPGRAIMPLVQAYTCAVVSAKLDGNVLRISYREGGLYAAVDTGQAISAFTNPVTGQPATFQPSFEEGPAIWTRTATAEMIVGNSELDPKGTRSMGWTWHSSGPRVWMINEDAGTFAPGNPAAKTERGREPTGGRILQTWHADRHDLDNHELTSVPCFKNYVVTSSAWPAFVGDPGERGNCIIRGMGAKLSAKQAAVSPDFLRVNRVHADFFAAARSET